MNQAQEEKADRIRRKVELRISEEAANSRVRRTLAHLKKIYEGDTDAEQ